MNYDTIILELLSRVQALEEQVQELKTKGEFSSTEKSREDKLSTTKKITTGHIKDYIETQKQNARERGQKSLTLIARDIGNELRIKQRYPMICNAMRQSMNTSDEIVSSPASGYSSTLEIKYYL